MLAAPYDDGLERCEPARWLHPPLQLAHDLAALWAHLARFPVRVKADGPIYQRDTPKLLAALPALELHGDGDPIATYRLQVAVEVLLEEQLVALRMDNLPGSGGRRELVASGDPVRFLALDPAELRDRMLSRVGVAPLGTAALALARRLGPDGPVAVTSFGAALRRLWRERDPAPSDAERVWTAREAVSAPAGMQCSTIDHSPRPPGASGGAAKPAALTDGEPVEVVLRAIGARGDPRRDLDAHALRAGRADERDVRAVDERAAGVRAGDHQTV